MRVPLISIPGDAKKASGVLYTIKKSSERRVWSGEYEDQEKAEDQLDRISVYRSGDVLLLHVYFVPHFVCFDTQCL